MLSPHERHFLRHVILQREWPDGTTMATYVESIGEVVRDPTSAVYLSRYGGAWQLGVIRRSGAYRGPGGYDWVLVEYRLETGHWVTANQPRDRLRFLGAPERTHLQWLQRLPRNA